MNDNFRTAQLAAKTVANYFLLGHWVEPQGIKISEIRELRENLTIVDFYLRQKRREIEAKLLGESYEHQPRFAMATWGITSLNQWCRAPLRVTC